MASLPDALALAIEHHQAGRLAQAETLYRQILAVLPDEPNAWHLLGVIAHQSGQYATALEYIGRAIDLRPELAEAHNNLGAACIALGRLDEAVAACRRAVELQPDFVEAHFNLANTWAKQEQFAAAQAAYRRTLELQPNHAQAQNNLGALYHDQGRLDEAASAYLQAVQCQPDYAEAYCNLGKVWQEQGRLDEAAAACRRAVAVRPDLADAHNNLAAVCLAQGQPDEARAACRRALELDPKLAAAYVNLGNAGRDGAQLDEALAAYRRAVELDPRNTSAFDNLLYTLYYHPGYDAAAIAAVHRDWHRQYAAPLERAAQPHGNDRSSERRLRIGYVSPDFRDHVMGYYLLPLLREHDRRGYEVFCYSDVLAADPFTAVFRGVADQWRQVAGQSDADVARLVRRDQIDILVDLSLHMGRSRLLAFARKPAPLQVTYLGYPGTTGLSAIDYRLTDPYLEPPGADESCYSEQSLRLSRSYWCFQPPGAPEVQPPPALEKSYITFGCLNNFCKLNRDVLHVWAQVLSAVPDARLLLFAPQGSPRQWVRDVLAAEGVTPERVQFVARVLRPQYLEQYHTIDVALDTFPYNGHATSLDALWMGVPVVTLSGATAVGRGGTSQLMNLGLPELIARTPQQYVQIAVALAGDRARLSQLRSTLRGCMARSPLMDAAGFTREVEGAYRQIWRRWCETRV